ncbi:hypothetical protein MRX96_035561 [Rhipicephalus microplus]
MDVLCAQHVSPTAADTAPRDADAVTTFDIRGGPGVYDNARPAANEAKTKTVAPASHFRRKAIAPYSVVGLPKKTPASPDEDP